MSTPPTRKKPSVKLRKARIRHLLMTAGPNRITRGWFYRRHHAAGVVIRDELIIAAGWPAAFDGIRIGHISDLHVGDMMQPDRAIEIVSQLREEQPDMVCHTGDLVDLHWPGVEPVAEAIGGIDAPLGNFFVTGNHDELDSGEDVERLVIAAGTTVLHDDVALVRRGDDTLRVGGIGWARTPSNCRNRIDTAIGDESVDLLLSHNPKAFDHAAKKRVPLTLSGHTHGGQIARRNRPNANMALLHGHRRNVGVYEIGQSRLFVTVGAGSWFPVRWNVPAEIAMLTIRSTPATS
jgi:hypothetical protein